MSLKWSTSTFAAHLIPKEPIRAFKSLQGTLSSTSSWHSHLRTETRETVTATTLCRKYKTGSV
jgi:hypothetical protein